jgi:HlyD family secretion protein
LRSAEKKLSDLSITATRDGILDSYPWNLGERVSIETVVAIVIAGPPYARVYIPETHRVNMKTGDTFHITVDGIDSPIQVRLRQIANDPAFTPYYGLSQSERARLVYLAEFDFVDSEYFSLPSGIPVELKLMD